MSNLRDRFGGLDGLPVELLFWPAEAELRESLARAGVPRVLLVEADAEPPELVGVDEDWVRMPANDADVVARAARLSRFATHLQRDEPYVDDQRILHRAGAAIPLSATEAAIMTVLLKHRGNIVPIADLEREVWNGNPLSRDAIDAAIYRLRRRLSGFSLVIQAVRNRGFVIHLDAAA